MFDQKQGAEEKNKHRQRMLVALALLMVSLCLMLVKDRAFWFGNGENLEANETPAPVQHRMDRAPSASRPDSTPKPKNKVVAKMSAEPAVAGTTITATTRTELPPMGVEIVAGNTHRWIHSSDNSLKVEMPPKTASGITGSTAFEWSPFTNAAERTPILTDQSKTQLRPEVSLYPVLQQESKVKGSVLLQALVDADGGIRDLRVLSGDPILISSAIEAARQWRFKPYVQNGQPVETKAKIMVIFTIKVL